MTDLEMRVEIIGRRGDQRFAYNYGMPELDLQDLAPSRFPPSDFMDVARDQDRRERLRKYTDLMAANVAHAFTEFMLKQSKL
jgi:hypothetical protein